MVILGGWVFFMSEVPLHTSSAKEEEGAHAPNSRNELMSLDVFVN